MTWADHALVVVGGSSGLGAAVVAGAVTAGATRIGVIDLVEPDSGGDTSDFAHADITSPDETSTAFARMATSLGRIDAVVNCAGIYPRKPILDITDAEWDASLAVNVKGTYNCMVAAVRHMREQPLQDDLRGRIVNISSVDAFKAHPANAHYAATKAAVISLTRSFAEAFAADAILVNAVAPAGMATKAAHAAGFVDELAAASPLGRPAAPEEIASWVLMAAGPQNTYMTGEAIIVSGGYIYG